MTNAEKNARILAAAASHGHNPGLFIAECKALVNAGLIKLESGKTAVGATKLRYVLVK